LSLLRVTYSLVENLAHIRFKALGQDLFQGTWIVKFSMK
jgi:hypothetical protein